MKETKHYFEIQGSDSDGEFTFQISRGKPGWFTDMKIQIRIDKEDNDIAANFSVEQLKEIVEAINKVIEEQN